MPLPDIRPLLRRVAQVRSSWRARALAAATAALFGPALAPAGVAHAQTAGEEAHALARSIAAQGPRPAGSAAERRAQDRVAARFRRAQLRLATDTFTVPGRGRSRNVIGIRDTPQRCLIVLMAHSDTVPPAPGADDNASGLATLAALATRLPKEPACDVWLVATGAEERIYTRQPDHLGALAVVRRIQRLGRARDLRFALSLDEVGRGSTFWLRSPVAQPRPRVERALLTKASAAKVDVRWVPDSGTGNSDHRELELAGLPAMKLGVPDDPCRHRACDTASRLQRGAFDRVIRVVRRVLAG